MIVLLTLQYISSKNSVALVIGVQDGFRCERPFIHLLQIFVGAGSFISILFASFGSSSKDLYLRCPIRAYQALIVGAVTRLTIASLELSANRMTYWFSIMLANSNTLSSAIISEGWTAFLKNTSILFLAKRWCSINFGQAAVPSSREWQLRWWCYHYDHSISSQYCHDRE